MLYSLILLLVQCLRQSYVVADGTYECGEHGRFEYCIDEIPGCIVGCHCHPGYYFDTDTKICEPNSKLLQHVRRQNVEEPTRVLKSGFTSDAAYETQTAASVNSINGQINEITKDADDLGDWLYNQFFKTIESQVVNNTNEKDVLTRRSGSDYKIKKPKRTNKWDRRKKPYKRSRNDKLKKKLLRITENDSLFDIASTSSSDSSGSSSSDSTEEVLIKNHEHSDNEHGHKKIVMINKKQKPPLPNFIFLPNLDTSYYPPLGLPPPPPIVPMYPMVPVPPVVPLFRLQVSDNSEKTPVCNNDITTTPPGTTSPTSDLTEATQSESITSTEPSTNTELTSTDPAEKKADEKAVRLLQRERKRKEARQRTQNRDTELGLNNWKPNGRQKILQQLRGKINKIPKIVPYYKEKSKLIKTPFMNQETEYEVPLVEDDVPDHINNEIQPLQEEISSVPENVDFKYITELIHRVDLKNKTDHLTSTEYNPLDSIEVYRPPRSKSNNYYRYYNSPINPFHARRTSLPSEQKTNDLYYTNLGRQIASMIRGIDSQNDQMKMIMEGTNQKVNSDPYFNIKSQKSFWERSVRSPLTFLNGNKNRFEYLKKSNEILFNIENKVEIMASTVPALSLQEIENIVKVMEAAKIDIQGKNTNIRNTIPSNKNLNINLWPQEIKIPNKNKQEVPLIKPNTDTGNHLLTKHVLVEKAHKIPIHNSHSYKSWHNPHPIENTKHRIPFPEMKSTKKPSIGNTYFVSDALNYNRLRNGVKQIHKTFPLLQKPMPPLLGLEMKPLLLKHRKYFQDNNNGIFNHYGNISHQLSAQRPLVGQPSYFHHQTNHFDFLY